MKHHWIPSLAFLVAASLAFGQDGKPEMTRGPKTAEPKPPVAVLVVGANEIVGSVAEPGWPIIVSSARMRTEGAVAPIPAGLKVRMTDEKDQEVTMVFEPVPQPAEGDGKPKYFWLAAEAATKGLAPGRYRITLVPDKGGLKGWRIESGDLDVVDAKPTRSGLLGLLKIQRSLLLGLEDDALAEAEGLTSSDAENVDAWIAKGDILMMKDKPDEALKAYDSALELQEKVDSEPLFILIRHRAAFLRSLEKRNVLPPVQPKR